MKTKLAPIFNILLISAAAFAMPVYAAGDVATPNATKVSVEPSQGEIKKIDLDTGKVTLKHGPIENLGMPGMTMVFKLSTVGMATGFKAGDAVSFKADQINGAFVVTELSAKK